MSVTIVTCYVAPAVAQGAADQAAAQALFDEGRRLMAEGKTEQACGKFAESQRLDPGIGTQFNLAECYEKLGRTASAWTLFLEVAAKAKSSGRQQHEQVARERAKALAPRLARLTVSVPDEARVEGLSIQREDIEVRSAQWGVPIPVDAGQHEITASAPGYRSWSAVITIEGDGAKQTLEVPVLEVDPDAGKTAEQSDSTEADVTMDGADAGVSGLTGQQYVGIAIAGAGLVGLGVSGFFGLDAKSKHEDSGCSDSGACPSESALELNQEANRSGTIATVSLIAGAVALGAGATVFLLAPAPEESGVSLSLTPTVGLDSSGIQLTGAW